SRATDDVVAWNQLGCLSPHVFYVQRGGAAAPEQFAAGLALELARREAAEPRGPLAVPEAATITSRRELYRVRAAGSEDTRLWHSDDSTAWTVVYEEAPRFQLSCLNRFVYVKAVMDLAEALRQAEAVRGQVSTVGLAGPADAMDPLATMLAHWGV